MEIKLDDIFNQIKKEKSLEQNANSKVLIVDGANAYIRAFSVNPTMNDDGAHIGGITGFFNTVTLAIRQLSPTRCIVVFDGKGGSQRRRKIYEGYKQRKRGLRIRLNRTYHFNDEDDEHKEAMRQLMRIAEYIKCLPITVLIYDNIEADDTIYYLAKEVFNEKVDIMSTDRDFIQLVDERISVWNPTRKKIYDSELVKKDYQFMPKNYLYYRIIEGDSSDTISGIKGIGIKTIQKTLPLINGDVEVEFDELIDYLEKIKRTNRTAEKLMEHKDILLRNYKLMKLGEIEIDGTTKSRIRELTNKPISLINKLGIKQMFLTDKLYSAIPNVDSWLLLNFNKLNAFALSTQNQKE